MTIGDKIDLLLNDGVDEKEIAREVGQTVGHIQARRHLGERRRKAEKESELFKRITSNLLGEQ